MGSPTGAPITPATTFPETTTAIVEERKDVTFWSGRACSPANPSPTTVSRCDTLSQSNGGRTYPVLGKVTRDFRYRLIDQVEAELAAMQPGAHGLTLVPLFAGERSTKWRGDARAAITGMSMHTRPMDILRAALEAVALRFRNLYDIMVDRLGEPREVVATGGALLRSRAWTQMMADALGRPVVECLEREASSRGAALLALERIGAIAHIRDLPAETGAVIEPNPAHGAAYEELLGRQRRLYTKLFEEP